MIERVARAIYIQQNEEDDWIFHESDGPVRSEYVAMACAAIEAMRELSDAAQDLSREGERNVRGH